MLRVLLTGAMLAAPVAACDIDTAFERLYNFDFQTTHVMINRCVAANPADPLPYAVRASAYLFYELDRLGLLEGEFFADDKRIIDRKKLKPDPAVRALLFKAIEDAQSRAQVILAKQPTDRRALFAMSIAQGINTDYTAFVEKRQIASLSSVRQSNSYAARLLRVDPQFYDAYLTTGLTEYLVGSLPFFIRWFVHMDNIKGSKDQGKHNLVLVARRGHYFRGFAKVLLGIVYLREKQPREAHRLLAELAQEYPANPLFKKELVKLEERIQSGGN